MTNRNATVVYWLDKQAKREDEKYVGTVRTEISVQNFRARERKTVVKQAQEFAVQQHLHLQEIGK